MSTEGRPCSTSSLSGNLVGSLPLVAHTDAGGISAASCPVHFYGKSICVVDVLRRSLLDHREVLSRLDINLILVHAKGRVNPIT